MNYIDLNKDLKKGNIATSYLFTGEEEFIMDGYVERILDQYVGQAFKDLNYMEIGRENDFDDVFNGLETLPFMSEKKLVLIKDIDEFLRENKNQQGDLVDYIDRISESSLLIMKDKNKSLRKNTRLYKKMKEKNQLVEFKRLNRGQLSSWMVKLLDQHNKKISNQDLNYLIDRTCYLEYGSQKSLLDLNNELKKIIDHNESGLIIRPDIDSSLIDDLETNIFKLLDLIDERRGQEALRLLRDMERAREPLARVLYMITRNFRLMMKFKAYRSSSYGLSDIEGKMKLKSFEFKKLSKRQGLYSYEELEDILSYLLEMDVKQKTSSYNEKLELEKLILRICNR